MTWQNFGDRMKSRMLITTACALDQHGNRWVFSVGALLPREAGDVRRLDVDVLAPSMPVVQADDAVLTPVSHTPRWGAQNGPVPKWGEISTDWAALESVGICINPQGLFAVLESARLSFRAPCGVRIVQRYQAPTYGRISITSSRPKSGANPACGLPISGSGCNRYPPTRRCVSLMNASTRYEGR